MITINGLHNEAICYTSKLEDFAEKQIRTVCDQAEFAGCKIRIMPDVHAGKGCTIGTTMTIQDKIVPGMVGVDIGCGMETVELAEREIDFAALDEVIRRNIPYGRDIRRIPHRFSEEIDLTQLRCADRVNLSRAVRSIGTLGGGNHFIEVDRSENMGACFWWSTPAPAIWAPKWQNTIRTKAAGPSGAVRITRFRRPSPA